MRKHQRPSHRHKQISIPRIFSCYKHPWQILHQFFQLMEIFSISFSLIFIRHPVHKSNPSKGQPVPASFKVIFRFIWRGSGLYPSPISITSWLLKAMVSLSALRAVFQQDEPGQPAGIAAGKSVGMHWSAPTLPDSNNQSHCHHHSQALHCHCCTGRTRWH